MAVPCIAEKYEYFKTDDYCDADFLTGRNYYRFLDSIEFVENPEKVVSDEIEVIQEEKSSYVFYYNERGQLIKRLDVYHGTSVTTYEYQDNGYLSNFNNGTYNFHYDYIWDNQRLFFRENLLQYRQTVEKDKNFYISTVETVRNKTTQELTKTFKCKYFYNKDKITKFEYNRFKYDGSISCNQTIIFNYDSKGRLIEQNWKIKLNDEKEMDDKFFIYSYDDKNKIIKIQKKECRQPKNSTTVLLYNFDKYGNWTTRKVFHNDCVSEMNTRKITYRE